MERERQRSVYNEIKDLRRQLDEAASSARKSRVAGQQLIELLGVAKNRVRLAAEAKPGRPNGDSAQSMKATQRLALAEMWRGLIHSAVTSVHLIAQGKSKIVIQDVRLPHKLLLLCNQQDELFDEERVALEKDQVKLLYAYCVDMLDDEQTQEVYGAEVELLSMLAYMCKRREFVVYFRPDHHISDILEQVEKRVLVEVDGAGRNATLRPDVAQIAASIFSGLLSTCQDLGIDLHTLLPGTIKFVAAWCTRVNGMGHQDSRDHAIHTVTYPILSGAAVLLRANPDLAVASLTRHGKPILKALKIFFSMLDSPKMTSPNQVALLEVTMRYLIACQVAGKLQGLMPGDLGNLGTGSLNYKTINHFLECLIQNIVLRTTPVTEKPSDLYKLQLELATRLLVCAQRKYLVRHEWNDFTDATETFVAEIKSQPNPNEYGRLSQSTVQYNCCAPLALSESPFVHLILRHLRAFAPSNSAPTSTVAKCMERWIEALTISLEGTRANEKALIALLHILATAAELFPLGSFWTSSAQNNWTVISDQSNARTDAGGPVVVLGSSSTDLAVVVHAVNSLLEVFGGFNAPQECQQSILMCLTRLVHATHVRFETFEDYCDDIRNAWTSVWASLFRTDLCYSQRTKVTTPDSVGDLVLRLLTDMVRLCPFVVMQSSEQDTYLFDRQSDVWNLPIFSHFDVQSPSLFALAYTLVVRVGLCDGPDRVGLSVHEDETWQSRIRASGAGRRSRLVCFCLHFTDQSREVWKSDTMVSMLSLCLAALINGNAAILAPLLPATHSNTFATLSTRGNPEIAGLSENVSRPMDILFSRLWSPPLGDIEQVINAPILLDSCDVAVPGCLKVHSLANRRHQASHIPSQRNRCSRLHEIALASLEGAFAQAFADIETMSLEQSLEDNAVDDLISDKAIALSRCANVVRCRLMLVTGGDCVAGLSKHVSKLFEHSSALLSTCQGSREFNQLLSRLVCVVRGLVSFQSSCLGVPLDDIQASLLYGACKQGLAGMKSEANTLVTRHVKTVTKSRDTHFDDELHRQPSSRVNLKRKRQDCDSQQHEGPLTGSCTQICLYLVSALVLALSPTHQDCELVAKSLLGVETIGEAHSEFSVDAIGGMYGVWLISSAHIVPPVSDAYVESESHRNHDVESVAILLCNVLKAIRASAKAYSKAHMFGGLVCADLVCLRDSTHWCTALSETESSAIVDLLLSDCRQERRSLLLRSQRRVEYIKAATDAFNSAGSRFHKKFDGAFGSNFVIPYISDINRHVRSAALSAVASAMNVLAEEKVIETVMARMPPISTQAAASTNLKSYRSWYAGKASPRSREESFPLPDNQVWEDAYPSFEHDIVACWCVIAESTTSHEVLQQVLFDLVNLAFLRPTLEGLCFLAAQRISVQKGFENSNALIEAESRYLIHRWLETDENLSSLPLMVTSPATFRRILQSGQFHSLLCEPHLNGHDAPCDFQVVRDAAALEFVLRRRNDVLPRIIVSSISRLLESSTTSAKVVDHYILDHKLFKEYCLACYNAFDHEVAVSVVRSQAQSILCDVLFLERRSETAPIAGETKLFMNRLLGDDFAGKCENEAWLLYRRVIEVASELHPQPSVDDICEVLQSIPRLYGKSFAKHTVDPFHAVNCSAAELLIYAKLGLDSCRSRSQSIRQWTQTKALAHLLLESVRSGSKSSHLGFCVDGLQKIVANKKLEAVHVDAICALREWIVGISDSQTVLDMKVAFFSVFDLHKTCQLRIAARCADLVAKRDAIRREQSGLIEGNASFVDGSEESKLTPHIIAIWRHCIASACTADADCLSATYDLLGDMLRNAKHLGLGRSSVQSLIDGSCNMKHSSLLAAVNPRFAARDLLVEFLAVIEQDDAPVPIAWDVLLSLSSSQSSYVEAELTGLQRTLHTARVARTELPGNDTRIGLMVPMLKRFFCNSMCKEVQLAASRCLGEVSLTYDAASIDASCQERQVDYRFFKECLAAGQLREALRATVVKRVSISMQNSDPSIALVAIDTLKGVLSAGMGRDCLAIISRIEPDTAAMLRPLVSRFTPHQYSLHLSEAEAETLRQSIAHDGSCEWCWSDELWQLGSASVSSFESWICKLVPALLVCHYDAKNAIQANDKIRLFHGQFQRMSCLDPVVAEALFPSLIVDLLFREGYHSKEAEIDPVLSDTWIGYGSSEINAHLSRCFDVLLRSSRTTLNFRAVESEDNRIALTDRKARVPYGTVISLDGALVAEACVQTRRFQAALYYAEMHFSVLNSHLMEPQSGISSCDMSGFGRDIVDNGDIVGFFRLLQQCFHELSQDEDKNAAAQLEWDCSFVSECGTRAMSSLSEKDPPSLNRLMCLDNLALLDREATTVSMSVVDCLEGLGLHGLMTQYVAGLSSVDGLNKFTPESTSLLRENLSQSRLYSMQWHDGTQTNENLSDTANALRRNADLADGPSDVLLSSSTSDSGYSELVVASLQALRLSDFAACLDRLQAARWQYVRGLASRTEKFGSMSLHHTILHLQVMNDLEDLIAPTCSDADRLCRFNKFGNLACGPDSNRFTDCIREITLRSCHSIPTTSVEHHLVSHLLTQFENSLSDGRQNDANGILHRLHTVRRLAEDSKERDARLSLIRLRLQEARIMESSRENFSEAIRSTKLAIRNLNHAASRNHEQDVELADSLYMCGKWVMKNKVEPASAVLENYFRHAAKISTDIYATDSSQVNADRATEALFAQGALASSIYDTVFTRVSSLEWLKAGEGLADREDKLKHLDSKLNEILRKLNNQSKKQREDQDNPLRKERDEVHSFQQHLLKEIKATRGQRDAILQSLEVHQILAMESIASALTVVGLQTCQDVSSHVYRLVSMWFSNDRNCGETIDTIMREAITYVPSFRFVPLVSQLVSRIDHTSSLEMRCFQDRLRELVQTISLAHPYHCLIHLVTIVDGDSSDPSNGKSKATQAILQTLQKSDPYIAGLIESYRKLTVAYVYLALTNTSDFKRGTDNLISFDKICKGNSERLDRCLGVGSRRTSFVPCILTKPPSLNPRNDYGDGVEDPAGSQRILSFESSFTITDSGINQPKIVVCIGANGGSFKQLVKGNDDTRQDAVMEQVFCYANALFARIKSREKRRTAKHGLRLVTYFILPLSHRAGVLEWVEDSTPFGDFIEDRKQKNVSARSRYFPGEWSAKRCMVELQKCYDEFKLKDAELRGRDIGPTEALRRKEKLRAAFDTICKSNSPVFRFFFVENFHQPEAWYSARMRYTRSVAVSSIVGHILGIGDRHMSNILVHMTTGEVIHIDFGIVFELGKRLKTPETVPFRLTRNVVDGMGPLGVEGSFTTTAESTLEILQQNADGLLTILSAVVSDPLYEWRIGSTKVQRHRRDDDDDVRTNELADSANVSENTNEVARHAITRVHEKLLGYEDGTLEEQQSVQSQVQLLINAARDEDNLCVMFPGWAPWQ